MKIAKQLSERRQQGAILLAKAVTAEIKQLAMENAEFDIQCTTESQKLSNKGIDQITFMLLSNLGESFQPLHKNASGGELSRIALVLQTLTSDQKCCSNCDFDEIDVGISGATANIVGKLLRSLGEKVQIYVLRICRKLHHTGINIIKLKNIAKPENRSTSQFIKCGGTKKELGTAWRQ